MVKMIKAVAPEHNCTYELFKAYGHAEALKGTFGLGTLVECSCGQRWTLTQDSENYFYWLQTGSERHE